MSGGKGAVRKIDLDAFCQLAEEVASFHTLPPGLCLVGPPHLPGIPRAKHRASFHLAVALFQVFQDHGIQ